MPKRAAEMPLPYTKKAKINKRKYEVEGFRGLRIEDGHIFFCIKWKGYPEEENTWEPRENLNLTALKDFPNFQFEFQGTDNKIKVHSWPKQLVSLSSGEINALFTDCLRDNNGFMKNKKKLAETFGLYELIYSHSTEFELNSQSEQERETANRRALKVMFARLFKHILEYLDRNPKTVEELNDIFSSLRQETNTILEDEPNNMNERRIQFNGDTQIPNVY